MPSGSGEPAPSQKPNTHMEKSMMVALGSYVHALGIMQPTTSMTHEPSSTEANGL